MSSIWLAAPIAWPMLAAALLLLLQGFGLVMQRRLALLACSLGLLLALGLLHSADQGSMRVSLIGNWPASIGIVLVLDRLSALMLVLTALLGGIASVHASQGDDRAGAHFHVLVQFQLMGLNGAFLTGDLFNLFVWFEVLLIASYGLLLHGAQGRQLRAGLAYVIVNLAGSALFLVALALIFGIAGTLNLADLGQRVAQLTAAQQTLMHSAALLLLVVFSLKAALLPLYFWLPSSYPAASGSVAVLFAILSKVGLYSILRVYTAVFGASAGGLADLAWPLLLPVALLTLVFSAWAALAARDLAHLAAHLVIASSGMTLLAFALNRPDSVAAGLSYLVQSTFATALLLLLADLIRRNRAHGATLNGGQAMRQARALVPLLFLAMIALAGLPPLPGFLSKALLLKASIGHAQQGLILVIVLGTGLLLLLALTRAFSQIAWHRPEDTPHLPEAELGRASFVAPVMLLALLLSLSVWAGPMQNYNDACAEQLRRGQISPSDTAPTKLRPEIRP